MTWSACIAQIIQTFGDAIEFCIIIGDVTYGACCVDDIKARNLMSCDYLIHYAHSCLVPLDCLTIKCLYVFVEIDLDAELLVDSLVKALPPSLCRDEEENPEAIQVTRNIAIMSTIQFSKCAHTCARLLREKYWVGDHISIPQESPLSAGETLGCTSVRLENNVSICIFISDGRFHIESAMIQNPHVRFYRYDPFLKQLFAEYYDLPKMLHNRSAAIAKALRANEYIVIMSTLGRQGCSGIVEHLKNLIRAEHPNPQISVSVLLLNELLPATLEKLAAGREDVCFVNVGCPRLSIDWGTDYRVNVVNSFELVQAMRRTPLPLTSYTMDYFSSQGGEWSNGPYRNSSRKSLADLRAKWESKKTALLQSSSIKT